jgi:glycogen operon protein
MGSEHKDVTWLRPDGRELTEEDWHNPEARALGMLIDGAATDEVDERGHAVSGDTLLLVTNGGEQSVTFDLPALGGQKIWVPMIDTARKEISVMQNARVEVEAHSLMLLRFGADRRISVEEPRREPLSVVEKHTL